MDEINAYISKRYPFWLDYAVYHAEQARLHDQGQDLLHTVLESLLRKDPGLLSELLSRTRRSRSKKDEIYTELDYFVLRMIKLNATSLLAPYRQITKSPPVDANMDPWRLNVIDNGPDEGESYNDRILRQQRRARELLAGLDIPSRDKEIFSWKFFADNPLRSWPGNEPYSTVLTIYGRVKDQMIKVASPENYRIQLFCRNFMKVRSKLLKAA
jgi:hypothetical protein